ncbi:AcrR family transcriptional regulator [Clostridium pascui]|uniref:TetR/AcrR family transcriptional regulator n=1 Tax=Clostridium pascui TaxID=46609 RepID=UPI00195EBD8E|nr:TetR/AcrR family transcriptional regulator [Clostridium pascui]MBM7872258.1 AcrR family transcriptional regulator [Clostridium pascui]
MNKTKKAIFESAIKVFSTYGYSGATMDAIAAQAGLAKGTLYYHFNSKEEIFNYIIQEGMNLIKERIQETVDEQSDSLSKLKTLIKVQLNMVYEKRDFFKVIMSQLWGQQSRQLELREVVNEFIKNIETYLERAMNDGFIKKGEKSFMAYTIFGSLCSTAIYDLINEEGINIHDVFENLTEYILSGIQI